MRIPAPVYRALERRRIDARSLLVLLKIYLKQDVRTGTALARSNTSNVSFNRALLTVAGFHCFLGAFLSAIPLASGLEVYPFTILLLTYTLLVVAMAVLVESGQVLLSESEADVLGHLPITPSTLLTAKILNLFLFSMLLAFSVNLLPMIAGIFAPGSNSLFPLGQAVAFTAIALFASALVVVSYELLIRWVSKERFDSIASYLQIGLVISVMLGFQILPRVLEHGSTSIRFRSYHLLFPPAWFAGLCMLTLGRFATGFLALAVIAILSLIVLGFVATGKVAASYATFESASGRLRTPAIAIGVDSAGPEGGARYRRRTASLWTVVRKGILKRPVERAVFDLISTYVRRNRETKLRVYPSLAYFVALPLLGIISGGLKDPFLTGTNAVYSIMGGAMIAFAALTAVEAMVFSDHFRAAEIFRVAPIAAVGDIHNGFRKAVFATIVLPGSAVLLATYSAIWRNPWHAFLLLLPWIAIAPVVCYVPFLFRPRLPLSRKYQKGQQSARVLSIIFGCMLLVMAFSGVQAAAIRGSIRFLPYWLFAIGALVVAAGALAALSRLSRERLPLPPIDILAEQREYPADYAARPDYSDRSDLESE